jgi:hypothetical protein
LKKIIRFIKQLFYPRKIIPMVPSKVDPNKKQARSSNDKDGEHLFLIDRMANTVSGPSQAPIHLAGMSPQDLYYECLNEGDAWQFSIPTLSYTINMQERYAVVRLTIEEFTRPVHTPQKPFSPYCDSDEESDCSFSSPCRKPLRIVPYIRSFVQYIRTFGAPD